MEEIKKDINVADNVRNRILSQSDLYEILPFGKTKVKQLLAAGVLPTMKIGNAHVTTFDLLQEWIQQNIGKEIYF